MRVREDLPEGPVLRLTPRPPLVPAEPQVGLLPRLKMLSESCRRERLTDLVSVPVPGQATHVSTLHSSHWTFPELVIPSQGSRYVLTTLTTTISVTTLSGNTQPHFQFLQFSLAGVELGVVVVESPLQLVDVLPQLEVSLVLILVTGAVTRQ